MAVQIFTQDEINTNIELGTNANVRTIQQTQSTPGLNPNGTGRNFGSLSPNVTNGAGIAIPFNTPGVGSANDDNTPVTRQSSEQQKSNPTGWIVNPQPNVLDQYASYTYNLSWYMLTPKQYAAFMSGGGRGSSTAWSLLMQSGGAATAKASAEYGGRNQYFANDYYMDNLVLESKFPGKGTTSSHNVVGMSFTVVEPNGISFIKNLRFAVLDLLKQNAATESTNAGTPANTVDPNTTETNWSSAQFVMVIDFYGYDDQGKLVKAQRVNNALSQNNSAVDTSAVVQKFIPFQLNNIQFKVQSKGTIEYSIAASPIVVNTAISTSRGSIPFNLSLVGTTLNEVLQGNPVRTNNNSGGGREDTSTPEPDTTTYDNQQVDYSTYTTGA